MKAEMITERYFQIRLGLSNRGMAQQVYEWLSHFEFEEGGEIYQVLRDFEGDFDGLNIWISDDSIDLIEMIFDHIGQEVPDDLGDYLKVTW